jgi:hypothetical protein
VNTYHITLPNASQTILCSLISGVFGAEDYNLVLDLGSGQHNGLTFDFNVSPSGGTKLSRLYTQGVNVVSGVSGEAPVSF